MTSTNSRACCCQAGVRFKQLDETLSVYGLAAVSGLCYTVGIAGFTLGGGWGMTSKMHGLGVYNVLEYNVVLASGESVTASSTKNPDLFWAMRGAGERQLSPCCGPFSLVFFFVGHQNFGVMVSMKYKLFPLKHVVVVNITCVVFRTKIL